MVTRGRGHPVPRTVRRLVGAAAAAAVLAACATAGGTATRAAPAGPAAAGPGAASGVGLDPGAASDAGAASGVGLDASGVTAAAANWPTYDRTGARVGLSVSTPAFTAASRVVVGWTARVDGAVYGQPLVVGAEVVVGTENNTVYAFARSTGRTLWRRHLAPPVTGGLQCGDINPSGITGTPVADVAAGRLWVVTFTPYRHTLWSLNLRNGVVTSHRGADGPGSDARAQQERGALALAGGKVFIPYGGLDGDCSDYRGWVVGAPTSGGRLVTYVTPTQREAGIWSPPGPSVGHGSIYVATGNGTPINAIDNSDSIVRLSTANLAVQGTFTPADYVSLSAADRDLGSTSPVLLPGHLVFQIGKDGVAYVVDALHLGGVRGPRAARSVCSGGFGGAAASGLTVVVSCFDSLTAVQVLPATRTAGPRITARWSATGIRPGPPIIAGGVVWDATRANQLLGYRLSDGRRVYATSINAVITSFPSLAASRSWLFVPEGAEVVAYRGI